MKSKICNLLIKSNAVYLWKHNNFLSISRYFTFKGLNINSISTYNAVSEKENVASGFVQKDTCVKL